MASKGDVMKLVGRFDSPFVRRVGVSLHALGFAFDHVALSPFSQATELRSFAPIGRMPALNLDDGEVLIDSAAILDFVDESVGPGRALLPAAGPERRKALRTVAMATAACDKAVAIAYERRRPFEIISSDWIARCRTQLDAALRELEAAAVGLAPGGSLRQTHITTGCMYEYVGRVEPAALAVGYPALELLSSACEALDEFIACRP